MDVLATRLGFPDEEVIELTGTAGNDVTFAPGVSALRPEGVIPIYVDATQTANDVAERITQAINQAVNTGQLIGVVPHRQGDLGYANPNTPIVDTNLVNLEGVTQVTLSAGTASRIVIDGAYGLNDPTGAAGNLLAPFHRDMSRVDVADMLDSLLEELFHNPTIITDTGLNFQDGDTFVLDDGINAPVIFEFDSGYVLNIPIGGGQVAAGGISDGENFTITDANGTTSVTFEFDKNGVVGAGHTRIPIQETESALGVARRIVDAVAAHPASNVLGLTPRILTGNRVQLGGTIGTTLTISPGSVVTQAPGQPGVSPSMTIGLPQTLGMQLPDPLTMHIPANSITDGETFVIDDGIIPPVTFEFEDTSFGDLVDPGSVMVRFIPASSEEEIGREMVDAINSSGLALQATMLGGVGNIDLGGGSNFALPPAPTSPMLVTGPLSLQAPVGGGAVINVGDQFFIDAGPTRFTFEFVSGGPTSDPSFIAIPFDAADSQDVIADRVLLAIQTTAGLNLNPVKTTGPARVVLGATSNVTLDVSQTHL
ncbi:MAG TPA: hypothetical protein VLT88_05245, partial [Desulfosarcina sp.]|nr:hypothetical protein [Desulfosarcina sp.]